jgi:hypothetical protein
MKKKDNGELLHDTSQLSIKKRGFVEAWIKSFGNITQACRVSGINRRTYYYWLDSDPEFKEVIESEDVKEQYKDFIEGQLLLKAQAKDTTMLIFLAKTQLKDRGYVEREEQEQIGSLKINITERFIGENGKGTDD